jgi:ATP-dependent RNA helicase DeaD
MTNLVSFSDLKLSPELMNAVKAQGYEKPSPIQALALPILLAKPTDFIGLAATGTGKTAAFVIPMLEKIDAHKKQVQALILCPTRELANQVCEQVNLFGKTKKIRSVAIYGGAGYGDQIHGLKSGAQVVVGTPGRVIDHLERRTLNLSAVQTVILDEADEMISMGFKEDIEMVLDHTPKKNNKNQAKIWLFSATMSREVRRVADHYLTAPEQIQINQKEVLSDKVKQIFYPTQESNKPEVLCKLIDSADDFFGIVFCQTKALVVDLCHYLTDRGYKVEVRPSGKPEEYEFNFVSYSKRKLHLNIDPAGKPHALIAINGKQAWLNHVFVKMGEKKIGLVPDVKYVELFGTDPQTGAAVYEKFVP